MKKQKKTKISVVMPSFNEEKAIGKMIEEVRKYSREYETEILLVDSSKDKTAAIAEKLGARVIKQEPQGHGIALRTAIQEAKNDIIITTDCDHTYPMGYIPLLVNMVRDEEYDIISCSRLTQKFKKHMPLLNKFGNYVFALLVRYLYRIKTSDVSTGMFCMKKEVSKQLHFETNYSFPCEIIIKSNLAGFRYQEIDIPYRERIGEITLNKWRSGKAYLKCIFNYKFKFGIDPKQL